MHHDAVTASAVAELLGAEIGAIECERIGDGLVGLNLRVRLLDAGPDLPASVVLKLPSLDETSRSTGAALRTYEREVKFYLDVAPTVDVRVPHCHHGVWDASTGDFLLVLEDMAPAVQGDQLLGCSVDRAGASLDELAKLHGSRWDDPSLSDIEWLTRHAPGDAAALWEMFFAGFATTYASRLSSAALDVATTFGSRIEAWAGGRSGSVTITHGDFRLDNLLFGGGAAPPVTVVDWQTVGHGAPVADVSYFCGAGLVPETRRMHERTLVERYGLGLEAYGHHVDETWLWEQYRREAFGGLVMAVIASQVVGESDRSEALFFTMASRHLQQAIDLDSLALV